MPSISPDLIAGLISCILTIMILSYLIGDNLFFRVAVYIFVGVSAGYAAVVAAYQVVWPKLILPILSGSFLDRVLMVFPLLGSVLLLMKISPRTARLGNTSMGFLVGVGAAVAVGGAVMGTVIPQTKASIDMFGPSAIGTGTLENISAALFILLGTVSALVYFHFGAKATPEGPQRNRLIVLLGWIGQVFIAITFGVLFAGAFTAALTALIERLNFIWTFIHTLL